MVARLREGPSAEPVAVKMFKKKKPDFDQLQKIHVLSAIKSENVSPLVDMSFCCGACGEGIGLVFFGGERLRRHAHSHKCAHL